MCLCLRWRRGGVRRLRIRHGLAGCIDAAGDAGDGSTTITGDAAEDDAGNDAGPALAKLTFVNAATDLGPKSNVDASGAQAMRLCMKLDGSVAPLPLCRARLRPPP